MSELNGAGAPSDRGRARGFALQWEAFWQPTISQAVRKLKRAKPQPLVRAARSSVPAVPFRVTVVVVNLNEGEFLKRTVDSLLATLPARGEIIVVDDGSTDGSQTFLTGGYNGVTLLRHTERLGVAGARNFGARHARGDVLVFADAHVAVSLGWEGPLLRVLENSAVGAVSPAIRVMRFPEDYSPDTWASSKEARGYGLTWQDASLGVKWLGRKSLEPYAIPLLGGAFLAMRHELFVASGGFDDGMILWGTEDSEISYRLWSLGYECLVVPSVEVAHHFRSKRPYDIDWVPVLHNRLRLAAIHFNEGRRLRVLDQLRRNACLDAALTRLNRGDTAHIRGRLGTVRCHDDDWFFQRFSDVSPPEFKAGPRQTNGPGTS